MEKDNIKNEHKIKELWDNYSPGEEAGDEKYLKK